MKNFLIYLCTLLLDVIKILIRTTCVYFILNLIFPGILTYTQVVGLGFIIYILFDNQISK